MIVKTVFSSIFICIITWGISQSSTFNNTPNSSFEKLEAIVVMKNKDSSLPHRAVCHPFKLAEKIISDEHVDNLIKDFLYKNFEDLRIDINTLVKRSIHKRGQIWYVEYFQVYNNVEVLNTELVFRIHENGNLFLFGLDYYADIIVEDFKAFGKKSLLHILKKQYRDNSNQDVSFKIKEDFILPVWESGKLRYQPVTEILVSDNDQVSDIVFVNQSDGNIEKVIHKCNHGIISGNCSGNILPIVATESQIIEDLPFLNITIDGQQNFCNENGAFEFHLQNSSAILNVGLKGKYVSIQNFNSPDAKIEKEVFCDENIQLIWDDTNSSLAERNVYYHIDKLHTYNKTMDVDFVALDYPLQCIVNDNSAFCNAYWNGSNLHFNTQDVNCSMNSAHGASVIYHEYGHAVNDRLYNQIGHPWGLKNPILHEAFSDIYSTLFLNDSRFALGWFGPGTMTRNLNNSNRYPTSLVGQQHTDGLILGGVFWDLGLLTTPEIAYRLSHYAKYGAPDDEDLAVAFAEVFLETLVADDDDGDLTNGSPNSDFIKQAFCNHGIGSDLLISKKLIHQEHPNTEVMEEDYRISVQLPQLQFGNEYDHITLVYSIDNFENQEHVSLEKEDNFDFACYIPPMSEGSLVKYYFELNDNDCSNTYYHPSKDYTSEYYSFLVGAFEVAFHDDFEQNLGWQLFNATDNASAGRWQRDKPQLIINDIGQLVSPENDFSEVGERCLVTGAQFGNFWYSNDVDGGKTTATSPVLNDITESSVFEFRKWFTHGSGFIFPAQGSWKVEVSNNGTDWIAVEQTNYGDHRYWIRSAYRFSDYIEITDQIQIRIEVSDFGIGSIVEGLFDDFKIYNLEEFTSIFSSPSKLKFDIFPNPTSNNLNIVFKNGINQKLKISLYSILGEQVRDLKVISENVNVQIDLTDVENGIYMLIIENGTQSYSKRVVVI